MIREIIDCLTSSEYLLVVIISLGCLLARRLSKE